MASRSANSICVIFARLNALFFRRESLETAGAVSGKKPFISIVLPAYNEEASIGPEIESIKAAMDTTDYEYEILIIDDGSTDRTASIAAGLGARVVSHGENRGGGAARNTGILEAKGEIIFASDADGTYPNDQIPKMLSYFPGADMVIGARTGDVVEEPWHRRAPKYAIRRMASSLSGIPIPDLNTGFRAFKKDVAQLYFSLFPKSHSWASTITLAFLCNGHPVVFHPINYYHRKGGRSSFSPFADTYNYIVLTVRAIMYFNPLRVLLPLSFWVFLVGIVKTTLDFFRTGDIGGFNTFLLVSAVHIAALGFVADLLVVLNRPRRRLAQLVSK